VAFIYEKPDPKSGTSRWMGRIRIGSEDLAVSLRLKSAGTKRSAQARVDTLQAEVAAGALSAATAEWLGSATTARLNALMARALVGAKGNGPGSWESAYLGYIKSCEAKDTKAVIPGTAMTVDRTKRHRTAVVRKMTRWLIETSVPFHKRPFTQIIIEYVNYRKSQGVGSVTLWSSERPYCIMWGEWMHKRGLCEKPDREAIMEHMPRRTIPIVVLPEPSADAASIRFFRDHRHQVMFDTVATDERTNGPYRRVNKRRSMNHRSAWSLALCVRGLGCRPSEATALMWGSVSKDLKVVHLLSTKTGVAREVPILFEWVRAGLEELRADHEGALCRSSKGKPFVHDTNVSACWKEILQCHNQPPYLLKKSQKCFIAHAIRIGFPPHVVANWTGHTLTVQEKHYCEGRSYLPSRDADVYGELGVLSAWGEEVRKHLSAFANLLPRGQ
jgi:integrase